MALQCSASLISAEEEVAAWLNVCHSALLSTIFSAVEKAEEPQGRAALISCEADAWASITKNFIFSVSAKVLFYSQEVGAHGTTSELDWKEKMCSSGQSLETPNEEENLYGKRGNKKTVVEEEIEGKRKTEEKLTKKEATICDNATMQSDCFGAPRKSASSDQESLIIDSQEGSQIRFSSLGRKWESVNRELENGEEPSPRLTESLLSPEEFASDLVKRSREERSEQQVVGQHSIASFMVPSLSGERASSENFAGWEDSSIYTDEEKITITRNDIKNNKELLCVLEAKVTALKSQLDKYVTDCSEQKMELDEIGKALSTKNQELALIMRNIHEKEGQLLKLEDRISVVDDSKHFSQEKLNSKENSLLAFSNEEILQKKQELLLVTAEVEKNEEIVSYYLQKIADSANLIQMIYCFVVEKERSTEYLDKCRELQEKAFQELSHEVDEKSKTIQEIQIKINDMTLTLSETESNVSEQKKLLQDLIASEKSIRQEIHSEEQRKEEFSQASKRIKAENEALNELLKKGKEEANALECKLVKLSEVVEDKKKKYMERGTSPVTKKDHSGPFSEETLHLTSISSSDVPTTSPLLNPSLQRQYNPTQEDGVHPADSFTSSLTNSLVAVPCPRIASYIEAPSNGGTAMTVGKGSSQNLKMNDNLRSQSQLFSTAGRQSVDEIKKDQIMLPYKRITDENGERSVDLPFSSLDLMRYDTPFLSGIADGSQFMSTAEGRSPPLTDTVTPTLRMIQKEAQLLREASVSESGGVYTPKVSQCDRLNFLPSHLRCYIQSQQKSPSRNNTPLQRPCPPRMSLQSVAAVCGLHSSCQAQSTASLICSTPFSGNRGLDYMDSKASLTATRDGVKTNGNAVETKDTKGEQNNYLRIEGCDSNSASLPCDPLSAHSAPALRNLSLVTTSKSIQDGFNDLTSGETNAAGNILSTLRNMRRSANVRHNSNLTSKNISHTEQ